MLNDSRIPLPHWAPPFAAKAPWWGGHMQTLASKFGAIGERSEGFETEQFILPLNDQSGDSLAATLYSPKQPLNPDSDRPSPIIVILHGLGGSSESGYVQSSADYLLSQNHRVLLIDFRGAGKSAEYCDDVYHPGRTEDIAALLEATDDETRHRLRQAGVVVVGFSLGGSVLLNFLAGSEFETSAPSFAAAIGAGDIRPADNSVGILGAVTISAPLDLASTSQCLSSLTRWPYRKYLLMKMRQQALAEGADTTDEEREAIKRAKTIWEFDKKFTAPRCGFDSVTDYYRAYSAGPRLGKIRVPTMLIYALDDPFVPNAEYDDIDWNSLPHLQPMFVDSGGHTGFKAGNLEGSWHDNCIDQFVRRLIDAPAASSND